MTMAHGHSVGQFNTISGNSSKNYLFLCFNFLCLSCPICRSRNKSTLNGTTTTTSRLRMAATYLAGGAADPFQPWLRPWPRLPVQVHHCVQEQHPRLLELQGSRPERQVVWGVRRPEQGRKVARGMCRHERKYLATRPTSRSIMTTRTVSSDPLESHLCLLHTYVISWSNFFPSDFAFFVIAFPTIYYIITIIIYSGESEAQTQQTWKMQNLMGKN